MFSALKEFLKLSAETEVGLRTANYALSYGKFDKELHDSGHMMYHSWTRNKERIFITLYACSGIVTAAVSTSSIAVLQPLFFVSSTSFKNGADKYLFGLVSSCSESGILLWLFHWSINDQKYNCRDRKRKEEDWSAELSAAIFGLGLEIVGIVGYMMVLITVAYQGGSAALYLLIAARFTQGLASYLQLESFKFLFKHFALQHASVALNKKTEESVRRKLVTRYDFTFFEVRAFFAPACGLLLFFLLPPPRKPLQKNSILFLLFNFYTANGWLFFILCICSIVFLWRQYPVRRHPLAQGSSPPLPSNDAHLDTEEEKNECKDFPLNSTISHSFVPYSSLADNKSICRPSSPLNALDAATSVKPFDYSTEVQQQKEKSIRIVLLLLIIVDFIVGFCAWGYMYNIFALGLQYRIFEKQIDLWMAYLPLALGSILAGYFIDFKRMKNFFSRYRSNCMKRYTLVGTSFGSLSLLLSFVLLFCIASPVVDTTGMVIYRGSVKWLYVSSLALLGAGLAWFFKTNHGVIHELIGHTHHSKVFQGMDHPSKRLMWLYYLKGYILSTTISRFLGPLVAGSVLVFQPKSASAELSIKTVDSLHCGISTNSYIIGDYRVSENVWQRRKDVLCWLNHINMWLISNIILMCIATAFLIFLLLINYDTVVNVTAKQQIGELTHQGIKADMSNFEPSSNPESEGDIVRCLYPTGEDISDIQYDIED